MAWSTPAAAASVDVSSLGESPSSASVPRMVATSHWLSATSAPTPTGAEATAAASTPTAANDVAALPSTPAAAANVAAAPAVRSCRGRRHPAGRKEEERRPSKPSNVAETLSPLAGGVVVVISAGADTRPAGAAKVPGSAWAGQTADDGGGAGTACCSRDTEKHRLRRRFFLMLQAEPPSSAAVVVGREHSTEVGIAKTLALLLMLSLSFCRRNSFPVEDTPSIFLLSCAWFLLGRGIRTDEDHHHHHRGRVILCVVVSRSVARVARGVFLASTDSARS